MPFDKFADIDRIVGTRRKGFSGTQRRPSARILKLRPPVLCRSRNFRLVKGNGWLSPKRACLKLEFVRQGQYAAQQFLEAKR